MTLAFALAGTCEVVTGLALRPAGAPGRLILIAGGLAGVLVAVNPEHAGGSLAHACWAGVGFAALVAWPGGAWRRGPSVPWGLRPAVSAVAAVIMLGLLAWFLAELIAEGGQVGLAERVMGVAQAGWPLVVVLSCRLRRPGARTPSAGRRQRRSALSRPRIVHVTQALPCPPDRRGRHTGRVGTSGPHHRAGPGAYDVPVIGLRPGCEADERSDAGRHGDAAVTGGPVDGRWRDPGWLGAGQPGRGHRCCLDAGWCRERLPGGQCTWKISPLPGGG